MPTVSNSSRTAPTAEPTAAPSACWPVRGIRAAREVYTTVPADAVRVAALVEISAAAAALARTVVKLRTSTPT